MNLLVVCNEKRNSTNGLHFHPVMLDVQKIMSKMSQTATYEQYTEIIEMQRQESL